RRAWPACPEPRGEHPRGAERRARRLGRARPRRGGPRPRGHRSHDLSERRAERPGAAHAGAGGAVGGVRRPGLRAADPPRPDPRPLPAGCPSLTEPYAVPLGDLQLLVFDDSAAPNNDPPPDLVAAYAAQVAQIRALASDRAWFLVHTGLRVIGHLGVENGVEQ